MKTALTMVAVFLGCAVGSALSPSFTAIVRGQSGPGTPRAVTRTVGFTPANDGQRICENLVATPNQRRPIECRGEILSNLDAAGIYAIRNNHELTDANARLDGLKTSSEAVKASVDGVKGSVDSLKELLRTQITAFNQSLQRTVAQQLEAMPRTVATSPAMAEFKTQMTNELRSQFMREVDDKIAAAVARRPPARQ
jgi:hypothetical protein